MTPSREASTTPGARLGQSDQCVETRIVTWLAVATVVWGCSWLVSPLEASRQPCPPTLHSHTAVYLVSTTPRVHRELVEWLAGSVRGRRVAP